MAIEQQHTLQAAEDAIKAGNTQEGERILKQIMETTTGEWGAGGLALPKRSLVLLQAKSQKRC